jgi:medium-chain acyl-[acyl-carrier-protein] hydrolase
LTSVDGMADALTEQVHRRLDGPYALFGHSMGGLVAFEVTRRLAERRPAALRLFVSAIAAPHLPRPRSEMHRLPRPDLIERLRRMNGTPRQVLEDRELMDLILPTIRADFRALEGYAYVEAGPLPCPISAFGGLQDRMVPTESLEEWRRHTRAEFDLQLFPGDHFFLATQEAALLQILSRQLWATAAASPPAEEALT